MFCLGHPCTAHRICHWGLIPPWECAVWKANNVQMWEWEHPPPSETEKPDSGPVGIRCRKTQKRLFIKNRQHKLHSSHRNKSASIMKKDNSDKCITFSHLVQMKDEKVKWQSLPNSVEIHQLSIWCLTSHHRIYCTGIIYKQLYKEFVLDDSTPTKIIQKCQNVRVRNSHINILTHIISIVS